VIGCGIFCDVDVYKSIGDTLALVCMNIPYLEMQIFEFLIIACGQGSLMLTVNAWLKRFPMLEICIRGDLANYGSP
jgi:hypothetical protein